MQGHGVELDVFWGGIPVLSTRNKGGEGHILIRLRERVLRRADQTLKKGVANA